jgi:acyl-coenzyme A thioesterase PaaI-like protein
MTRRAPDDVVGIEAVAHVLHPACFACRERERGGLGLRFREEPDGSVAADFDCPPQYQGYPDRLHGGIVAMLLDSAMTHCLFARGIRGVTARLTVRFVAPVEIGAPAVIRAIPGDVIHPHKLRAEIVQGRTLRATAEAVFIPLPEAGLGKAASES